MFRKIYLKLFKPYRILDTQLVSYKDADTLIRLDPRWEIAKQEDENLVLDQVWIQKREYLTE